MLKRLLSLFLCLMLLMSFPIMVFAEEAGETEEIVEIPRETLTISNKEDLLTFAEKCRLDSYSQNLDVTLVSDIDLSGTEFAAVPIFCGTFDGGGHTVSGLSITAEGSVQGLFRYLTETAVVRDLNINGEIYPEGSKAKVGSLAGSNAGYIENCSFSGSISGGDYVGGLVGVNTLTGTIEHCRVEGQLSGNHFVGGIAGDNQGVIRDCTNFAHINTTPQQNTVEIGDITLQTLTGSESANTVTDIGGIAGTASGVIRSCVNRGNIGYQQMGYNVGGIAGSLMGYMTDCMNYGDIFGRKEVGGIVGQMEPVTKIEYSQDTLQILDEQLDTMSGLTNQAAANAQSSASKVTNEVAALQAQIQNAQEAIENLVPDASQIDPENPQLPEMPDEDALLAAQNTLSSSLSGMQQSIASIAGTTQSAAGTLSSDLQAVANQAGVMGETLNEASENLGGSVTDVSDLDTQEDLTGKITDCVNHGSVLADLNAGGIAGAVALENDLDPEEDVSVFGDASMNFATELRAVIRDCRNQASVTAKKQHAGGIAGWMQFGLVKDCENYGALEGDDYVGGIAGRSQSYIRSSSIKCSITGAAYVGGIAGSGTIVSDCRSMADISAVEKQGSVLGEKETTQEENPVTGNLYLSVEEDLGGIDGVSFAGVAQSLTADAFFALEGLPEQFHMVTVQFLFENGSRKIVFLESGVSLQEADIPKIPEKDGYTAQWEDLHMDISFDTTFTAEYLPLAQTLQSQNVGENGLPVLLMEGVFSEEQLLDAVQATQTPAITDGVLLEAWQFEDVSGGTVLRCLLPENADSEYLVVFLQDGSGSWRDADFTVNGSYAVTELQDGDQAVALVQLSADDTIWYAAAGGAVVLIAVIVLLCVKKKKNQSKTEETA